MKNVIFCLIAIGLAGQAHADKFYIYKNNDGGAILDNQAAKDF